MWNRRSAGVTLVELIVAMVIIGVALAGTVAVFARSTRASADPVIQQQMAAIADNMMEEVLQKPFVGPSGGVPPCPASTTAARATFYEICDYNNYGKNVSGVKDVEGNAVAGLEGFNVLVTVANVALTNVASADAAQVTVTVSYPADTADFPNLVLNGWRTRP